MREMVLNHASISANDSYTATEWLKRLAVGMALLSRNEICRLQLRMSRHMHEIECADGLTLHDLMLNLINSDARDEGRYLSALSAKVPLLKSVSEDLVDKFLRCQAIGLDTLTLSSQDSEPLVYAAITDGVAIGFPSNPVWTTDEIEVHFIKLALDEVGFVETYETIDNLTRPEHADAICERNRTNTRQFSNFDELWEYRDSAFPNLIFGPDVEGQLKDVNTSDLSAIVKKLSSIDDCAADWQTSSSAMPAWSGKVTPESDRVRNNRTLMDARRFRSHKGSREVFEWHARFGRANRIHLRFDAQTKEVEIGYIGKHLPL